MHKDFWLTLIRQAPEMNRSQVSRGIAEIEMVSPLQIDSDDPIISYFQAFPEAIEIEKVVLDSPVINQLIEYGVKLAIPLISQGNLVGILCLNEQKAEEIYPTDDPRWLSDLAHQKKSILQIASLIRSRHFQQSEWEGLEYERSNAQIIQETLIPRHIPTMLGWQTKAYWQPTRDVCGDFFDFFTLSSGRLGLVIGDVTDTGLPTALVMATTRSILLSEIEQNSSPGQLLSQVNNQLYPNIPRNMFITCLCAILDPITGSLSYANAGHNLPICQRLQGIEQLHATGMPLGLFPDMDYEEGVTTLEAGDRLLLYSDGLVEAHNQDREMFGFGRLRELVEDCKDCENLEEHILAKLDAFTGEIWEQEDDIAFLLLRREQIARSSDRVGDDQSTKDENLRVLGEFSLPSEAGLERLASETVLEILRNAPLDKGQIDRLTTAVAEATMNAIEHGNQFDREKPVIIKVTSSDYAISVHITDQGVNPVVPDSKDPDLEAKLAGLESPRGWGLFIIRKMVDHFEIITSEFHHTVILTMFLGGEADAR